MAAIIAAVIIPDFIVAAFRSGVTDNVHLP